MTAIASTHFDISQLPSLKDGMTAEEESMKRTKTCRFIEEAGRILKLPRVAVSTAMVFFHRFYAKHSFQQHDRFEVAVAAIVLAAKTEESPKKLNTVIMECHKLKTRGMQAGRISQQGSSAASGGGARGASPPPPPSPAMLDPKGEEFLKLKERILLLERVILHTIGFELSIDHPYKFFVEQIKKLIDTRQLKYKVVALSAPNLKTSQLWPKMMNELVQYSMSFANDSMHTSLCLQFSPQLIATSCIYLAGQFAKVEPAIPCQTPSEGWSKILGQPDIDSLASICIQIMELIADRKASETDSFKKIRAQLELLKSRQDSTSNSTSDANASVKQQRTPPPPPAGEPTAKRPKSG
jgi:cyclin T